MFRSNKTEQPLSAGATMAVFPYSADGFRTASA